MIKIPSNLIASVTSENWPGNLNVVSPTGHWGREALSRSLILSIVSRVWKSKSREIGRFVITISRKVVGKNEHATIPKGNMGYDQYTVPDFVAVEPTFAAFL